MITALLLALAVAAIYGNWIVEKLRELSESKKFSLEPKAIVAAVLVIAAIVSAIHRDSSSPTPEPEPKPTPAGITLVGEFTGPDASKDAATVSAICAALADDLEWDMAQPADRQLITTGQAFDSLRTRSRILICRGESLGDKHPRARDSIERYLNDTAGTSGGPLTREQRLAWIDAYRNVARAAEDAAF